MTQCWTIKRFAYWQNDNGTWNSHFMVADAGVFLHRENAQAKVDELNAVTLERWNAARLERYNEHVSEITESNAWVVKAQQRWDKQKEAELVSGIDLDLGNRPVPTNPQELAPFRPDLVLPKRSSYTTDQEGFPQYEVAALILQDGTDTTIHE